MLDSRVSRRLPRLFRHRLVIADRPDNPCGIGLARGMGKHPNQERIVTKSLYGCLVFALLVVANSGVQAAELVSLATRPGVEQRFILIAPDQPKASVILFAGGKGALNLSSFLGSPTIDWGKGNFLVRTRDLFVQNGFQVAVVDAPSDRQGGDGMYYGFRDSAEHVVDMDGVIRHLRDKADVPVWLIGTSRGTESAAHLAINSKERPDGLILTSSMSVSNNKGTPVTEMDLQKIVIPTLIVGHTDDGCKFTPPDGSERIAGLLVNARNVQVKMFSGGDRPCRSHVTPSPTMAFSGLSVTWSITSQTS